MQRVIYTTKYYCTLCKKDQAVHLYGDSDSLFTPAGEPELIDWAMHYHWIDHHRLCALCGKLVKSDDLELLANDNNIRIHEDYTDEYEKINRNDRHGRLLIVHSNCLQKHNE